MWFNWSFRSAFDEYNNYVFISIEASWKFINIHFCSVNSNHFCSSHHLFRVKSLQIALLFRWLVLNASTGILILMRILNNDSNMKHKSIWTLLHCALRKLNKLSFVIKWSHIRKDMSEYRIGENYATQSRETCVISRWRCNKASNEFLRRLAILLQSLGDW